MVWQSCWENKKGAVFAPQGRWTRMPGSRSTMFGRVTGQNRLSRFCIILLSNKQTNVGENKLLGGDKKKHYIFRFETYITVRTFKTDPKKMVTMSANFSSKWSVGYVLIRRILFLSFTINLHFVASADPLSKPDSASWWLSWSTVRSLYDSITSKVSH